MFERERKKIEESQQLLNSFSKQVQSKIDEINPKLTNIQLKIEDYYYQENQKIKKSFLVSSKEEALQIAEILSKKQDQDLFENFEGYFSNIEKDRNYIIQETQKYLQNILNGLIFENKVQENLKCNQESQTTSLNDDLKIQSNLFALQIEKNQNPLKDIPKQIQMSENNHLINQNYKGAQKKLLDEQQNSFQQQFISLKQRPYELIFKQRQYDECYSMALNREQTILVAGCGVNKIVVFEFKFNQMVQKQILANQTSGNTYSLVFMSKTSQFLSGTFKEIGIWNYDQSSQQWNCKQLIKDAHTSAVCRVIINDKDDLIVSCSEDKKIKFWVKKSEWEHFQTLTNQSGNVCTIAFNDQCNQLVSCGSDKQILISSKGNDNYWTVIQTIQTKIYGSRIAFIDNNILTFQPFNQNMMEIYQLDEQTQKYIKTKEVTVEVKGSCQWWFQQTFSKRKQILINKNGYMINLMRKQNNDFIVEQALKFEGHVYGMMSDDGEFLVTWDLNSREFQIRRQQ